MTLPTLLLSAVQNEAIFMTTFSDEFFLLHVLICFQKCVGKDPISTNTSIGYVNGWVPPGNAPLTESMLIQYL